MNSLVPDQAHSTVNPNPIPDSVSRRSFLRLAGASLPAAASLLAADSAAKKVPVGAHPWVYAAKQPGYDLTPILDLIFGDMSYAGMEGIELMHTALRADDAEERIRKLSAQHQLPVIGASFGGAMWDRAQHAEVLKDAELVIPRLARLGGRTLGTSVGAIKWGQKLLKTPEQLDAQAELLKKLISLCQDHGVVLNLHNHTYEVENGLHDLKGTLARLPDAKLGPDLNWLIRGGVDPVQFIRDYGKQIVFLHLRDQKADGKWAEGMGDGCTDFGAIANALRDVQFAGTAVIELAHERDFQPTRPLRETLKQSREFVRNVFHW